MLVFEQGQLSKKNLPETIFAGVNYLSTKTSHIFHLHYHGKLVKEKLLKENLLVRVYNRQFFLDKGTSQGKLASVNEALING